MQNMYGDTALTYAAKEGHSDCIIILINSGADVNNKNGYTALMWAAIKGHSACIRILIEVGADVNARAMSSNNALLYALVSNCNIGVYILIEAGADINVLDNMPLDNSLKNRIKKNIYTLNLIKNSAYHRRKHALLFYKTQYLDNYL